MSMNLGYSYYSLAEALHDYRGNSPAVCEHLQKIVALIAELDYSDRNYIASFEYHGYGGYIEIWDTSDRTCRFNILSDGRIVPAFNDADATD